MDELFEKLKAEPPVNRTSYKSYESRRESLPSINATPLMAPLTKCRSLSPIRNDNEKDAMSSPEPEPDKSENISKEIPPIVSEPASNSDTPKKTPTKAQKKLFEPIIEMKASLFSTNETKVQLFKVRIKRDDLEKMQKEFANEVASKTKEVGENRDKSSEVALKDTRKDATKEAPKETPKEAPTKTPKDAPKETPKEAPKKAPKETPKEASKEAPKESPKETAKEAPKEPPKETSKEAPKEAKKEIPKASTKRKTDDSSSPPTKKGRKESPPKKSTGFFIKLSNSLPSSKKVSVVNNKRSKSQSPSTNRKTIVRPTASSLSSTTKATKFSRSQLIQRFGKRFFNSTVKIKKCKHPLMLTFESNARAHKEQQKNKSKKLSVSFKEQVEIIGGSDTESNYSDEIIIKKRNGSSNDAVPTPARLKKVENGEVNDDIEMDVSLFDDADAGSNSSTPLRKKVEKKSYSPLKDDSASTAKSELLKLANEVLPCGLRRLLGTSIVDDDDDDDDSANIEPIELPDKRPQVNSLNENGADSLMNEAKKDDDKNEDTAPANGNSNENNKDESLSPKNENKKENKKKDSNETQSGVKIDLSDTESFKSLERSMDNSEENLENNKNNKTASNTDENDAKRSNGNGKSAENGDSLSKEENTKKEKSVADENESIQLVLENDSNPSSPDAAPALKSPETPSEMVIDKLSADTEMSESKNFGGKEQNPSVKSTKTNKMLCLSA